jgi:hypothetical protein
MVHGSTHTGAALESTPDGREGWFPYFVRKGVSTYVVDHQGVALGLRSVRAARGEAKMLAGDTKAASELIPNFGRITDNGAWTAWFGHCSLLARTSRTGRWSRTRIPAIPKSPRTDGPTWRRSFRSIRSRSTTNSSCRTPR